MPDSLLSHSILTAAPSADRAAPLPWFALVVRPGYEKRIGERLSACSLEAFVPCHDVRRRWSDRTKVIRQSLFPGYVFCRFAFADRFLVLGQPGVRRILSFDRTPHPVPEEQILAVRRAIGSGLPLGPWPYLKVGQRIRIERGVLEGVEGTLARAPSGWRIVLSVDVLCRSIAVEVDSDMVRPIPNRAASPALLTRLA